MNPRRLAFIDLDDTLLGPDKAVSPENVAALAQLRAAGVQPVIASGRHHLNITMLPGLDDLGWVLSSHGAVVRHAQTGEVLREANIDAQHVEAIFQHGREHGVAMLGYHRCGVSQEGSSQWTDLYAAKTRWNPKHGRLDDVPASGFSKILWTSAPEHIGALAGQFRERSGGQYHVLITEPELLEFFATDATKAGGAAVLADSLGVAAEDSMAFGDGSNDVEILQWAGISVAMAHGRESARQAARFVSPAGPRETAFARAVEVALGA